MPLQRVAMATTVICIGILLLSACGLPLLPPSHPRLHTAATHFALYSASDHTLLATGVISATEEPDHIPATLTFLHCPEQHAINLTGILSPTLTLNSLATHGPQVHLEALSAPVYRALVIFTVPFSGTLTSTVPCATYINLPVTAEQTQKTP